MTRKLIELPEPKLPNEVGKVNDPKYCKCPRVVGHPIEKCFVVKEKILGLARDGNIIIDTEDVVDMNVASIASAKSKACLERDMQKVLATAVEKIPFFQFRSLEPAVVKAVHMDENVTFNEDSKVAHILEDH